MKSVRALCALSTVVIMLVATGGISSGSSRVRVNDGFYSFQSGAKTASVGLTVAGHGTRIIGGGEWSANTAVRSGLFCDVGATPPAGIVPGTSVALPIPRNLPIAANGSFSYSGTLNLTPGDTQSSVSITAQLSISGRFTGGKVVARKTVAVSGTASTPLCPGTLTHFALNWDPNA
ncbi:MAG TPA: hypothetical protein VGZ68_07165 [Acidimicrobiales bacterium]|jgi:hypothetical protein|nr:hypothetical protein [Acidimicrobiales bacterium]